MFNIYKKTISKTEIVFLFSLDIAQIANQT